MESDPNRREVREAGNLLIEAVSLLVQRQRETESWIAEQIGQAEERATATERLTTDFETRLGALEAQLARLVHDGDPLPDDAGIDEQLERLREQVEGLTSGGDVRSTPVRASAAGSAAAPAMAPTRRTALTSGPGAGVWGWLGQRAEQRFGSVLMGAGALAVLYGTVAVLAQLRFG